jgi:hypothetical protein
MQILPEHAGSLINGPATNHPRRSAHDVCGHLFHEDECPVRLNERLVGKRRYTLTTKFFLLAKINTANMLAAW